MDGGWPREETKAERERARRRAGGEGEGEETGRKQIYI